MELGKLVYMAPQHFPTRTFIILIVNLECCRVQMLDLIRMVSSEGTIPFLCLFYWLATHRSLEGCQFFITTGQADFLDGKHCVFGKVLDAASMLTVSWPMQDIFDRLSPHRQNGRYERLRTFLFRATRPN